MPKIIVLLLAFCIAFPVFAKEQPAPDKMTEIKAALEKDKQDRIKKCSLELQDLLKKYRLTFHIIMLVTEKGNMPQVSLVPVD